MALGAKLRQISRRHNKPDTSQESLTSQSQRNSRYRMRSDKARFIREPPDPAQTSEGKTNRVHAALRKPYILGRLAHVVNDAKQY